MTSATNLLNDAIEEQSIMMSCPPAAKTKKLSTQALFLIAVIVLACAILAGLLLYIKFGSNDTASAAVSALRLQDIPFNGQQAYEYLKQLCAIGPRPSGSPGMEAQQKLLAEHFKKLGGIVVFQRFQIPHPVDKTPVSLANMIIHWHPQSTDRILLCAHYDTLPFPMLDKRDPRGIFLGANDNAGGVALLMELAHQISKIDCKYGIDFLLIDGEEFIFSNRDRYFLGSEYFAREYVNNPPKYRYRYGVLLDMIGDKDLQIYQERNSLGWKDTRLLVEDIWSLAARLGVREFIPRPKYEIRDDHIMLHNISSIACIDVIDYDYPPWHTQSDTPENCSALSLAKVGWVLVEWLKTVQ